MAIFRGTGSASATADQTTIDTVTQAVADAEAAQTAAETAQGLAETAKTSAENLYGDLAAVNTAKTSAETAATTATTKASEASDDAADAQKLALHPVDSQFTLADGSTTGYSALHYNTQTQLRYDNFDDRYLGSKAVEPSVDNDGDPLITGAMYFDTTDNLMYVWTGTGWVNVTPSSTITVSQITDLTTTANELNVLDVSAQTPTDGQVLTYDTTNGLNWETPTDLVGISNVVEDTTPQLGGTLDANGNIIDMGVYTITDAKVGQWDTAYGWGDHGTAGYLTSYTETDPVYTASTWYTTTNNATNWDTAYGWGDHSTAGYVSTTSDETISGSKRGTVVDNTASLSFDMNAGNNFKTTPTATGAITFTNITSGQSGNIYLNNATPVVISAADKTHIASADLTTINTAGAYWLSYYSPDGTNVYVSTTPATTNQGL